MNGMGARKNPIPLIRAFQLIRKEIPESVLRLVGVDYEVDGKAHAWAKTNGLEKGCEFVGPLDREQLVNALDTASLMIHPALEESFGNVLIEAMARRVPVLGGKDSGAVPWVLDGGRAGAICDVRNPEGIAREAIEILTSRKRWMKLSQTGYERARDAFSLSSMVDLCLAQYQRILNAERER
jgi:glycosyltransferase involved in cell wall biosynthesis